MVGSFDVATMCSWKMLKWTHHFVACSLLWPCSEKNEITWTNPETSFCIPVIDFLISGDCPTDQQHTDDFGNYKFRPEDVVNHLGKRKAEELAMAVRTLMSEEKNKKCKKNARQFVSDVILGSISSNRDSPGVIYKKRKGSKRTEYTYVNSKLIVGFSDKSP